MNILQCKNKHYYDADTYAVCPHCDAESAGGASQKTPTKQESGNVIESRNEQTGQGGKPAGRNNPKKNNGTETSDQHLGKTEKGIFGFFDKTEKTAVIPEPPKGTGPSKTPEPPKSFGRKEEKEITSVLTNESESVFPAAGKSAVKMNVSNPAGQSAAKQVVRPPVNLSEIPAAKPPVNDRRNSGIFADKQITLKEDPEPAPPDSLSIDSLFEMKKDDAPDNGAEQSAQNVPQDHNSLSKMVERISSSSEGRTMSYFNMASSAIGERRTAQNRTPSQAMAQTPTSSQGDHTTVLASLMGASGESPAAAVPKNTATPRMPGISEFTDPVVGWLICVAGPNIGRDYRIGAGTNSIGRDGSNRIAVFGDNSISRDKHCMVIYEPKKMQFFLKAGDSTGLTYLNGEYVTGMSPLKAGDVLEIGASRFYFLPLCGDRFKWENYLN